ncbi:nuclear transport factor 2 family protein [Halogeometricum limi]|uniref:Ketosteroid isomerase-related protein n=1 Tax=Halogeometricum limi TaxID=555875 RepID=A0A1I6H7K5_9EURY|nr:nuclear transport factor 2 family protein [Halogeometricum limi]SFR50546.1 Ketosteroid isomerase-related protein [Halogeometricum limi]
MDATDSERGDAAAERTDRTDGRRSGVTAVRGYYDAIDAGDYDRLSSLLSPAFVHDRPDRTFSGRETFVSFMRADRPETDTTHDLSGVYRAVDGDADGRGGGGDAEWVARGRLVGADGDVRFRFADVFTFGDDGVERVETFVRE